MTLPHLGLQEGGCSSLEESLGKPTIRRDAPERFLQQFPPVKIQSMEPWRIPGFFERRGVFMSILGLHSREARDA